MPVAQQTTMQQSAVLLQSHLSSLHHLRTTHHGSTPFMSVKANLHLSGQNQVALSHQTLCPMNIHKHHPEKLPRSFYHAHRFASFSSPPPLSLFSFTYHALAWVVIIHSDVSSGHVIISISIQNEHKITNQANKCYLPLSFYVFISSLSFCRGHKLKFFCLLN